MITDELRRIRLDVITEHMDTEVSKEFGSGKNRVRSLQDINFEVNDGEIMAILGPSGCGKTTLLRIIAGLEQSSNGDVLLDGEKVVKLNP